MTISRLTESDRVLQKAPLGFDDSVWEIFEPLMMGAQIVMARSGGHQDSRYLANLIVAAPGDRCLLCSVAAPGFPRGA